ncbi:glucose-6-phosphate dehydrogenase [Candidatus Uhrbacteria bacterium]|nr:glucose-6-phosphate dehydrogenase [Candidatus Uhrbacteria bacterium]
MAFKPGVHTPTIFIVLGATGDLMARKVLPALFNLFETGRLPARFQVVGFSRRELTTAAFQKYVEDILLTHKDIRPKRTARKKFIKAIQYVQGNFDGERDYERLAKKLAEIDKQWGICSSKLFHLAVPPHLYETILKQLARSGLTKGCGPDGGWMKVIVEKPFGKNFETAEKLDTLLGTLFREGQIYRIDHYLGKAMIHNILAFRFSNKLFEEGWDRDSIEQIRIRLLENLGVKDRGAFYDGIGALRDVGQNHMLQMLALTTMDPPQEFSAAGIRRKRYELLSTLRPFTRAAIRAQTSRGQYQGYSKIKGVAAGSKTETFFKINLELDAPRWRGVPITLTSGKSMGRNEKDITIVFKHPTPCLCPARSPHTFRNEVVFEIEPEESIRIRFWAKKPGLTMELEEREFYLPYHEKRVSRVEEYAKLLYDCIAGDQTLFVSTGEVQAMWRFIDPIVRAWQKNLVPLAYYKSGQPPKL